MKNIIKLIANINIIAGFILLTAPIGYLLIIAPNNSQVEAQKSTPEQETSILTNQLAETDSNVFKTTTVGHSTLEIIDYQKPKETIPTVINVPKKTTDKQYIKIPSIGMDTQVYKGDNANTLDKGVWIMPGHGNPEDSSQPIVLAAHRWGPNKATYEYRKKNLFYNLPNIKNNDLITINWNGTDYNYKVTSKEENQYVSKIADLVLITCKYYNSPIRIIVYAQKV